MKKLILTVLFLLLIFTVFGNEYKMLIPPKDLTGVFTIQDTKGVQYRCILADCKLNEETGGLAIMMIEYTFAQNKIKVEFVGKKDGFNIIRVLVLDADPQLYLSKALLDNGLCTKN